MEVACVKHGIAKIKIGNKWKCVECNAKPGSNKYVLLRKAKYEAGQLPAEHPDGLRCDKHGEVHRLNMTSYSYRCEKCRQERNKESVLRNRAKVKDGVMPKVHPTAKCEAHCCALTFVWDTYRCVLCSNDTRRARRALRKRKTKQHVGKADKQLSISLAPKIKVKTYTSERQERFDWPWEKYAAWLAEHPIPVLGPIKRDSYTVMSSNNGSSLLGFADYEEGATRHTRAKRMGR